MRIAVSSDMDEPVARLLVDELRRRGHTVIAYGALRAGDRKDWAWSAENAARDLAEGRADQAVVCCWTGTGASIAANKVPGARTWNDANALALSRGSLVRRRLREILDAWFAGAPSGEDADRANVAHLEEIR